MEKNIHVQAKENKHLKRKIKKLHRFNLSKNTSNIYLQRISRKKWIKISLWQMFFVFLFFALALYVISTTVANIVSYYLINQSFSFNALWLIVPDNKWGVILASVLGTFLALPITLLAFKTFLVRVFKKTNWNESEESGTAHFLTDERNPWTIKPIMEAQYYPKTYFLDKGDWIIRLEKTNDYDEFLNQAQSIFTFKDPDGADLKDVLKQLSIPLGYYQEEVKYTCANDVITDIKNFTHSHLINSPKEFKSLVKQFLINKNLKPILIQTAGDSANAYVLGATGSGKTTKLNYPTILANANAKQQPSFFVSDPKGELYNTLSGYLTARGYEPYSLDLFDLIRSMGWNPLQDVYQKFLAKSILKEYLKQYEQARVFFACHLAKRQENEDQKDPYEDLEAQMETFSKDLEDNYLQSKKKLMDLAKEYNVSDISKKEPEEILDDIINLEKQKRKEKIEKDLSFAYEVKWNDKPIIDERINLPYPLFNEQEYLTLKNRLEKLNITSLDNFVFDDSDVLNSFALQTPHLQLKILNKDDKDLLKKYVCSIHTGLKANEKCICDDASDKIPFILFDNYIFKTHNALKVHFSSTLNTQISEQIRIIQNAIFYTEKQDHWIASASKIFGGMIYHLGYKVEDDINSIPIEKFNIFSMVAITKNNQVFNEETFFAERLALVKQLNKLKNVSVVDYDIELKRYRLQELETRQDFINLVSIFDSAEEEGKSIISTFDTKMNPFLTDGVKLLTSFNDITFEKLISNSKPIVVFVGINVNDPTYHPFITLFISTLHQKLSEKAKKSGGKLDRYFMFMLDEFGNIPAIPNYGKILSTCRSENIKFMSIVQSNAQIEKNYEKDKDNIITNKGLNIYIKSNDVATAEYYSKVLGSTMIDVSKTQSAREKGWIVDKKDYKQRSLMTPDEIYNLDCQYYHDTLFVANSKPIMVQVAPWYKIFNTKDFSTYRPIQYKLNQYSIVNNQLNYKNLTSSPDYILDYYSIKSQDQKQELLENQIKQKEEEFLKVKEEFNKKVSVLDDQKEENSYYVFSDLLINTYNLTFDNVSGISKDELRYTLASFEKQINKTLFFQNYALLNMYAFSCSRDEFIKEIHDYLAAIGDNDIISQSQATNYQYIFDNQNINGLLILIAKQLITNELSLQDCYDKYPNLKDIITDTHLFLEDIVLYELSSYIKQTDNNYELKLYDFLTRFRNFDNDDLTITNSLFKALVSLVDKQIYINLNQALNNFDNTNMDFKFILLNASSKQMTYFLDEYLQTNKNQLLLDNFWSSQIKDLISKNIDKIQLIVK